MSRQNLLAAAEALIEDESDDELDDIIALASIVSARTDRNRVPLYYEKVIGTYFDFEFMRLFRLSRETHAELAGRYEASAFHPDSVGGRPKISVEKTLLIVLSYLGTRATMYQCADRFDITESSVHLCIERVLNLLNGISAQIITWPDQERRRRSQAGFLRKTKRKGPHKTIGAIVEILRPTESPNSYYNRSKFHSIVLQGICGDQNRFIDIYIGFPGSAQDANILKESPVLENAEAKCADRDFFDDLNNARPPDQVTNDDDHAIQPDDATRSFSERIREAIAKTEC
ncbi:hypothetical protein HPB47_015155 [Ixodes persulcatus]|uniref:Uncharacterized protein n=1 Tax=Ixodes persulcatus TaxID=34615 RepID=A0AC60QXS9_IXOPE|nr:hypothetical protein HPB47_015155 [Ixodes persulcatus]